MFLDSEIGDIVVLDAAQHRREMEAFRLLGIEPPQDVATYDRILEPLRRHGLDPVQAAKLILAQCGPARIMTRL